MRDTGNLAAGRIKKRTREKSINAFDRWNQEADQGGPSNIALVCCRLVEEERSLYMTGLADLFSSNLFLSWLVSVCEMDESTSRGQKRRSVF